MTYEGMPFCNTKAPDMLFLSILWFFLHLMLYEPSVWCWNILTVALILPRRSSCRHSDFADFLLQLCAFADAGSCVS